MKTINSVFANNLRQARERKDWTLQEAANRIRIKRTTLGAYEYGRAEPPQATLKKILAAYGVDDDIYGFMYNHAFFKNRTNNLK